MAKVKTCFFRQTSMVNSPVLRVHLHDVVSAWETRESRQLNLADMRFKRKMFEDWLWFVVVFFPSSHGSTGAKIRNDSRFSITVDSQRETQSREHFPCAGTTTLTSCKKKRKLRERERHGWPWL